MRTHRGCFGDFTGVTVGRDLRVGTGGCHRYSYHVGLSRFLFSHDRIV